MQHVSRRRILVVDDEARIREVVEYALKKEGFEVVSVSDGIAAVGAAQEATFDLVVLDVMLPGMDGLEVCRQLRASTTTPVLFLSARGEEVDRVVGLELGGDDYLTKPFSPRELVARVRAVLRRTSQPDAPPANRTAESTAVIRHGDIVIDIERHEVRYQEQLLRLTPTELNLLVALYQRPGVVLSRDQLMERAYDDTAVVTERTLDTHVRRIRSKFRKHGGDPIATVHGVGYKAND